jgi:hypothetical protein
VKLRIAVAALTLYALALVANGLLSAGLDAVSGGEVSAACRMVDAGHANAVDVDLCMGGR